MEQADVYIGVVGPSDATAGELSQAEYVGREIGGMRWKLVCGGMGGVMEAACRGARSVGGTTIGLLPGMSREGANPYLTVSIPTGMGELRNGLLVRGSDALVAIGGSWGTLSEISFALRTRKTVVGLATWTVHAPQGSVPGIVHVQRVEQVVPQLRATISNPDSPTRRDDPAVGTDPGSVGI